MAASDTFPVDPYWPASRTREGAETVWRAASGETFRRPVAARARLFDLVFPRHSMADWAAIEQFRLRMAGDFFTFEDVEEGRKYSCYFAAEPSYSSIGYEQVDISVQLVEAVGKPLLEYPTTPLLALPLASAQTLADGKVFLYSGYGYKITGSGVSSVELDGASAPTTEKYDVPLLLHRLKIKPAGASLTSVEVVH